jgi:hypothetical protein
MRPATNPVLDWVVREYDIDSIIYFEASIAVQDSGT